MGIIISLIVFSFLVFFHELGHFLAARFFGVKVEVFSIGFGKRLFTKKIGETEYSISAIPLGGYVKMKGQEDLAPTKTSQDQDSYSQQHPLKRIIILLAGPFGNFLLAFFIYVGIAFTSMNILLPIVGNVLKDSPAQIAGLEKNDEILRINSHKIGRWEDISKAISAQDSTKISVLINRQGKQKELILEPKILESQNIFGETIFKKMIGIAPIGKVGTVSFSAFESIKIGVEETYKASKIIFLSVVKLIEGVVGVENIGGIISIVDFTSKASEHGLVALLTLSAIISVNLGVLNLLPIPALDGGHIVFVTYELITKKPPKEQVLYYLTLFGWAILISLMLFGIYNDINRLSQ